MYKLPVFRGGQIWSDKCSLGLMSNLPCCPRLFDLCGFSATSLFHDKNKQRILARSPLQRRCIIKNTENVWQHNRQQYRIRGQENNKNAPRFTCRGSSSLSVAPDEKYSIEASSPGFIDLSPGFHPAGQTCERKRRGGGVSPGILDLKLAVELT